MRKLTFVLTLLDLLGRLTALAPLSTEDGLLNRRNALLTGSAATTSLFFPLASQGVTDAPSTQAALASLLQGLRSVPTFCIVNGEGAAYMLYKQNERNAVGYAFITFAGALAVLGDAKQTAEKGGYSEVWETSTITMIPADIAVRLALQPRERTTQKESLPSANSIISVIPGIDEREAAIKLDSKYKDQAKVPLFFIEKLLVDGKQALYFSPVDLLKEWKKRNAGVDPSVPPRIQVVELVSMFQYVLRGRAAELPIPIDNVVFVPTADTLEVAARLKKEGLTPYKTDRMII